MGGTQLWAGPAEFGWVARGSGGGPRFWNAGMQLWSWGLAQFGWAARGSGAGGPHGVWMGGGPVAGELGARGVWMGGTRLWSRAPAVLMHVPGTFNIDGLSAGWVTACTHTC